MTTNWKDELNLAQKEAVMYGDGPLLVIAGAGTGKTKTLAGRVAWLIENGTSPDRILLLTFTRRAATEMLQRATQLSGQSSTGKVWGGTFHATANRLLRQYGRAINLPPEFTVMDQSDSADLMNIVRSDLGHHKSKRRFPNKNTLISVYSRVVNSRTKLKQVLQKHFPWCEDDYEGVREIFGKYRDQKREQHVLDYDDLLLYWSALNRAESVASTLANRFDYILVDEYQDTNTIQAEILEGLCPASRAKRNIMVVGDDAQSIYSFRAATVENIIEFPEKFEGTKVIKLEENYRSVQPILDASNAVMELAEQGYEKTLYSNRKSHHKPKLITCRDEDDQSTVLVDAILKKLEEGVALKKQAVLFRAGWHSDRLEVELTRRNVPFVKFGGLKFVEAAHVKDMLGILRILENPDDELSWFRVLQLMDGVGPVTARKIIQNLKQTGASEQAGRLRNLVDNPPVVPAAARAEFDAFRSMIRDCIQADSGGESGLAPSSQVERIRKFYQPIFTRVYDNPTVRVRDLDQLEQVAGGYQSRSQFLTDLTLDPPSATQDLAQDPLLDEDYLILSTIHSAKGCEWDSVSIIHTADGMIPSDMACGTVEEIEEERRLLYVAMTRARDSLDIYCPLRYYKHGSRFGDTHTYAQLTRFIPDSIHHLFDREGSFNAGDQTDTPQEGFGSSDAIKEVDGMLDDLWGD